MKYDLFNYEKATLVYLLNGYLNKPPAESFREAVIRTCLELI